jgi:hypothetical protein
MRIPVRLVLASVLAATVCAAGATGPAAAAIGKAPVTIKGTAAGHGLLKGATVPRHATIEVDRLTRGVVAGSETSLNVRAPKGQAVVGATSRLVGPKGKVLATWFGTFSQGPLLIDGQFKSDAGLLVSVPENEEVPHGSIVVTYVLFRTGGKSIITG